MDFTLLLLVCLASALFSINSTLRVSGPFVNISLSFGFPQRKGNYSLADSWKCKILEMTQLSSRKGP